MSLESSRVVLRPPIDELLAGNGAVTLSTPTWVSEARRLGRHNDRPHPPGVGLARRQPAYRGRRTISVRPWAPPEASTIATCGRHRTRLVRTRRSARRYGHWLPASGQPSRQALKVAAFRLECAVRQSADGADRARTDQWCDRSLVWRTASPARWCSVLGPSRRAATRPPALKVDHGVHGNPRLRRQVAAGANALHDWRGAGPVDVRFGAPSLAERRRWRRPARIRRLRIPDADCRDHRVLGRRRPDGAPRRHRTPRRSRRPERHPNRDGSDQPAPRDRGDVGQGFDQPHVRVSSRCRDRSDPPSDHCTAPDDRARYRPVEPSR
jgi:hypothetical protein